MGIIQYQRGLLDHARHTLENGRQQAHTLKNKVTECKALLSLGDVYQQLGQLNLAKHAYSDARTSAEELGEVAGAMYRATAEINLARISILNGEMHEAESHLHTGTVAISKNPLARQLMPKAERVQGHLVLTEGNFTEAQQHFSHAYHQAEVYQDMQLAAEAHSRTGTSSSPHAESWKPHKIPFWQQDANSSYLNVQMAMERHY